MSSEIEQRKTEAATWFAALRDRICAAFESLEDELTAGPHAALPPGRFERRTWERAGGGVRLTGAAGALVAV